MLFFVVFFLLRNEFKIVLLFKFLACNYSFFFKKIGATMYLKFSQNNNDNSFGRGHWFRKQFLSQNFLVCNFSNIHHKSNYCVLITILFNFMKVFAEIKGSNSRIFFNTRDNTNCFMKSWSIFLLKNQDDFKMTHVLGNLERWEKKNLHKLWLNNKNLICIILFFMTVNEFLEFFRTI